MGLALTFQEVSNASVHQVLLGTLVMFHQPSMDVLEWFVYMMADVVLLGTKPSVYVLKGTMVSTVNY